MTSPILQKTTKPPCPETPGHSQQHLQQGATQSDIAATYNVTAGAVSTWIRHHDIQKPPKRRPTPSDLHELYITRGQSLSEIADEYHVTKQAVAYWLKRAGITPRPQRRLTCQAESDILRLNAEHDLTLAEISQHVGFHVSTISQALRRHGTPPRRRTPAITTDQIATALAAGTTPADIAQQQGCSLAAVYRAIKRADLHTPTQLRQQHAQNRAQNLRNALDNLPT